MRVSVAKQGEMMTAGGKKRILAAALVCLGLMGCANFADPATYEKESDDDLCWDFRFSARFPDRQRAIATVIDRRHLTRPEYFAMARKGVVSQGMNRCEVLVAWGHSTKIYTTHSGGTKTTEFIFQTATGTDYVYMVNGQVTSTTVSSTAE